VDLSDLYDEEIARIPRVWQQLMAEFSKRPNTKGNLEELAKRANEEFLKIGLIVEVNTLPTLIFDPYKNEYGNPEITILGRIPGTISEFDHEKKGWEVVKSRDRGEDYLGQKD